MAKLTSRAQNFPRWYQDVIAAAELADNGPVRGTMVIRPYAYAMWEHMQAGMDGRIKAAGAENAYFPLLIPEEYMQREAEHVEGFRPELAVVTHGGGKELESPVVIRPTSETIIGEYLAKWIQSYRDLPFLLNQWSNVVRWELRPRLFLRTSEFLWQEGHTAHASATEATAYARRIHLEVYRDFMSKVLRVPVHVGIKTARERFAGAVNTLTCEALMGDGKALQMATSHELGQNFARSFNIDFTDRDGTRAMAWTTSWGSSTRMIGGVIMVHGDDNGLRLPPDIAPAQAVVLPVRSEEGGVMDVARRIVTELKDVGVRARLDAREGQSFGRRTTDWELRGAPVRIEVGPRDLAQGQVTLVTRSDDAKAPCPLEGIAARVQAALTRVADELTGQAAAALADGTCEVATLAEAQDAASYGLARLPWAKVGVEGETLLATQGITVRCLSRPDGTIPDSEDEPDLMCLAGRAY